MFANSPPSGRPLPEPKPIKREGAAAIVSIMQGEILEEWRAAGICTGTAVPVAEFVRRTNCEIQ